eukprot:COSAG05_NODE_509_length_9130_cov_3.978740_8_plen_1222_part_00
MPEFVPGRQFVASRFHGRSDEFIPAAQQLAEKEGEGQKLQQQQQQQQNLVIGMHPSGPEADGWIGGEFVPTDYGGTGSGTADLYDGFGAYSGGTAEGWPSQVSSGLTGWFELDCTPCSVQPRAPGITAVACDAVQEMVWVGSAEGCVTAMSMDQTSADDQPTPPEIYTSVRGHDGRVGVVCANRFGVLSVSETRATFHSRGGILKHYWDPSSGLDKLRAACFGEKDICYLAGECNQLHQLSLGKGQLLRGVAGDTGINVLKTSRSSIACGGSDGSLVMRDTRTMAVSQTLQAHSHSVLDLDIKGHTVVTCGYQKRFDRSIQAMGAAEDRFINVFDVRMNRQQLSQIPCMYAPYQLRFHPNFTSIVFVLSSNGVFQQFDVQGVSQNELNAYTIESEGDFVQAFDVSRTAEVLAFGDSGGFVHRWADRQPCRINPTSEPIEKLHLYPGPPSFSLDIDDPNMSLPVVHLYPSGDGGLFSDMRFRDLKHNLVAQPPRTIAPELMARVETRDSIGVIRPVPDGFVRNSGAGCLTWKHVSRAKAKAALSAFSPGAATMVIDGTPPARGVSGARMGSAHFGPSRLFSPGQAMKMRRDTYTRVNLKIKQLEGIQGFDFGQYNRTSLTGLENALPNSYTNPLLQFLYFTPALRSTMLNRLSRDEVCLCDELHFLFAMMDDKSAIACFPNNFLRAFRQLRPPLNLVASEDSESSIDDSVRVTRIANCLQFLLEHLHKELLPPLGGETSRARDGNLLLRNEDSGRSQEAVPQGVRTAMQKIQSYGSTVVGKLFSATILTVNTEPKSGTSWTRDDTVFLHSLAYPTNTEKQPVCFHAALQRSLCKETSLRTYVPGNEIPQRVHQKKIVSRLPPVLLINCGFAANAESKHARLKWLRSTRSMAEDPDAVDQTRPMSMCATVRIELDKMGTAITVHELDGVQPNALLDNDSAITETETDRVGNGTSSPAQPNLEPEPENEPELEPEFGPESETLDAAAESRPTTEVAVYDLSAMICLVHDPMKKESSQGGNIVAIVKVPASSTDSGSGGWTVFNDFCVQPISDDEALQLCGTWKLPCILSYARRDAEQCVPTPDSINHRQNLTAYMTDFTSSISRAMRERVYSFTPLTPTELESGNLVVGIDAEFVALSHEVTSTREDGSRVTIIPARFGLARVSIVRGDSGPLEGIPIMDHYISSPEPVVDYLTRFSGVEPGDLDPAVSRHYVTNLKSTYLQIK